MDIGTLTGQIALEDQLTDQLTVVASKIKTFFDRFKGMTGVAILSVAGLTAAVTGMAISIQRLSEKGSVILGVERAFNQLAISVGQTGDALLEGLNEGVKGTVDSMELMKSVNAALTAGVKLNKEQTQLLGAAGRELGKAMGTDAAGGIQMLSSALATGRTRQLAMHGITVDLKKAYKDFAASIGTTADKLNDLGKKEAARIAILQATKTYMDKVGVSELSMKERFDQVSVAIGNWYDNLAKAIAQSPNVARAFDAIKDAIMRAFGDSPQRLLDKIVEWVNRFADAAAKYGPIIIDWAVTIKDQILHIRDAVITAWDLVPDWFKNIAKDAAIAGGAIFLTNKVLGAIGGSSKGILETVASYATITSGLKDLGSVVLKFPGLKTLTAEVATLFKIFQTFGLQVGVVSLIQRLGVGLSSLAGVFVGPVGITALLLAFVGASAMVAKAFYDMYKAYQESGFAGMWEKLTTRDTNNWVRRAIGLGDKTPDILPKPAEPKGPFVGPPTPTPEQMAENAAQTALDASTYIDTSDFDKKVKSLYESITTGGEEVKVITAVFSQLDKQHKLNSATIQAQLLPSLDKIIAAHQTLNARQQEVYESGLKNQIQTTANEEAQLDYINVTLESVQAQQQQGLSLQQIATRYGVTSASLSSYMSKLESARRITDEVTKSQEELAKAQIQAQLQQLPVNQTFAMKAVTEDFQAGRVSVQEYADARIEIEAKYNADRIKLQKDSIDLAEAIDVANLQKRVDHNEFIHDQTGAAQKLLTDIHAKYALQREDIARTEDQRILDAAMESNEAIYQAKLDLDDKLSKGTMSSTEYEIKQIERTRLAKIKAFADQKGRTDTEIRVMTDIINKDAKHQTDLANHTYDTIEERMREHGVLTKKEEDANLANMVKDYGQMVKTSAYSTEAIRKQWHEVFVEQNKGSIKFNQMVGEWSHQLTEFAQVAGDSFGGVVKDIAGIVTAWNSAIDAGMKFKEAQQQILNDGTIKRLDKAQMALALAQGATAVASATQPGGVKGAIGGAISGGTMGAALGSQIGAIGGPLGIGIGAGVGALVGYFRQRAEMKQIAKDTNEYLKTLQSTLTAQQKVRAGGQDWAEQLIAVSDAYVATGRTAEQGRQALVKLWNVKNAKDYEAAVKEINHALELTKLAADAADTLSSTEEKYHLSLNQTGSDLYRSFQILVTGGHSAEEVLSAMHEDFQSMIDSAMKFGTAIPLQMKPLIQQLIDQGQLLDANGEKMTDISQLKFTEVGTSGYNAFDRMVTGVDKLVAAIKLSLHLALTDTEKDLLGIQHAITTMPTLQVPTVTYTVPVGAPGYRPPDSEAGYYPSEGAGMPNAGEGGMGGGPAYYAHGGVVTPRYLSVGGHVTTTAMDPQYATAGMLVQFQPRGTDTVPIMATPGERVLTVAQNKEYEQMQRQRAIYEQMIQHISPMIAATRLSLNQVFASSDTNLMTTFNALNSMSTVSTSTMLMPRGASGYQVGDFAMGGVIESQPMTHGGDVIPQDMVGMDTGPMMTTSPETRNQGTESEANRPYFDLRGAFIADGPSLRKFLDEKVWPQAPNAILRDIGGVRKAIKRVAK